MISEILFGLLIAWIVAEVISGFIHFLEDSYGNPEWEHSKSRIKRFLYTNVVAPNILHHQRPVAMTEGTYWERNNTAILPALFMAACFWWYWPVCLGFIIMTQANEIHGWSHIPHKCNRVIRFFQRAKILQTPQNHKLHHTRPYSNNYCVFTNIMNPILEYIFFWPIMRITIWLFTGTKPLEVRKIY